MSAPGQPLEFTPPSVEELSGRFPHLVIEELIGAGGMGAVYRARQVPLDRPVALKILPAELARDPDFLDRFTREAQSMARLNHPHLVAVYDFGNEDGRPYLVMEFIEGRSLEALIAERRLSPERAARLLCQLCDGLAYAHAKGILHRDIKPANILISDDGVAKIGDFGLARAMKGGRAVMQRSGQPLGTPGYAAPEVYEISRPLDHRTDIYALGALFYEMLTGQPPADRDAAPPSAINRTAAAYDAVVARAMAPSALQRFGSALDMKGAVMGALHSPRPAAAPTGDVPVFADGSSGDLRRSRPSPPRQKVAGIVLVALAALGALAWGFFGRNGSGEAPVAKSHPAPAVEAPANITPRGELTPAVRPAAEPVPSPLAARESAPEPAPSPITPPNLPPTLVAPSSENSSPSEPQPQPFPQRQPIEPISPAAEQTLLSHVKSMVAGGERGPGLGELVEGAGGRRYLAALTRVPWLQARTLAEKAGGHLITITTAEEQALLLEKILPSLGPAARGVQFWLGATDEAAEGNWRWVTGEPWEFVEWAYGEPNGAASKNFLATTRQAGNRAWSDSNDVNPSIAGFILEWDPGAAPPSSPTTPPATAEGPDNSAWSWAIEQLHAVVAPITKAHDQKVEALRARYVAALQRTPGNGDSTPPNGNREQTAQAFKLEIERFRSSGTVPDETPADAHPEIARVQNIWRTEYGKLRRQLKADLQKLQPPYLRALESQKEKFVREGATTTAEKVGAEIGRLNQSPEAFLTLALGAPWVD